MFLALPAQAPQARKDIVFRFIIEYIVVSFRDFYKPLAE
jgi:hypothetical protein